MAAQPPSAKPVDTPAEAAAAVAASTGTKTSDRVLVYKFDGSRQCQAVKGTPPEVMRQELRDIPVFSGVSKPDGQPHIKVCGSITGQVNVFEIPATALGLAERRGFKPWSFE